MDDQGSSAPAQWAADPSGRHRYRYWDGTRWTGHVYDGADAPVAPPREAPVETPRDVPPRRSERPTRVVVEPTDDDPTDHPRDRGAALDRRSFAFGVAAGALVVAIIGVIASLALSGGGNGTTTVTTRATTTTEVTTTSTTSPGATTTTLAPGRPPAQVRVEVLNASGTAGAASTKATALKTAGYTIAGTGNSPTRTGTVVQCNAGFESEAVALTQAVGSGATNQPASTPGVSVPSKADCVVIIGK
jgi:hypothetical protein